MKFKYIFSNQAIQVFYPTLFEFCIFCLVCMDIPLDFVFLLIVAIILSMGIYLMLICVFAICMHRYYL